MQKLNRFKLLLFTLTIAALIGSMSDTALMQRQAQPSPTPVTPVDINGRTIAPGEKFIAQRVTKDGKVIMYRQNKTEVEALIKGLKEDGVADSQRLDAKYQKLLDANYWLGNLSCKLSGPQKCDGKCGGYACQFYPHRVSQTNGQFTKVATTTAVSVGAFGFCDCPLNW